MRYRRLAEQQIVSTTQLDQAELGARTKSEALSAASFAVTTAEHDLEVARAATLEFEDDDGYPDAIEIRSPIDGVVLARFRESEAVVPAGDPLLEVADPGRLEVVSDFLSTDAVRIRSGDRVRIEQWGGEETLGARVRRVEPSGFTKVSALGVEEQRVNVIIDFEDSRAAWEALGDGYRVEARVVVREAVDVLVVPTMSLFRKGAGWAAFAVEEGRARLRQVEIGAENGILAEVLSGVSEGETLLVYPGDAVQDGVRVEPR